MPVNYCVYVLEFSRMKMVKTIQALAKRGFATESKRAVLPPSMPISKKSNYVRASIIIVGLGTMMWVLLKPKSGYTEINNDAINEILKREK